MPVETPTHHTPQTQPSGSLTNHAEYGDAWALFASEITRLAALSRQRRQEREALAPQTDTKRPDVASIGQ